ncbi:MAG TPA: sigma-70 family RNA polymerase sigma factor [Kofleriaceae bacterium]|jgi:RNA polymerase sigma factor (sigma-70 family)
MERSDAELLEAARREERQAFGTLVERYQGAVCAVTYSRTGDRALSEDVAQDTFLAAWGQLHQVREVGRLRAWLCGIARNLARKARRRASKLGPLPDGRVLVFEGANPFDAAAAAESARVVRDALARVPATYRDALVLYYREHRSVREVAAALGITEAAALQRLARGRQYLADGVTDLVERSLGGASRPSRDLPTRVLAALPLGLGISALAPSRAHAATRTRTGGSMFKLVFAGAALTAAAGTTAIVVHSSSSSSSAAAPVAASMSTPASASAAPVVAARSAALPVLPRGVLPAHASAPSIPEGAVIVPDTLPRLDAATIAAEHLTTGPSRGPATAPVTITVFSDLTCSHCGNAVGTLDQLFDEYPNQIRLVMKQMPVRDAAHVPAEAALAADAQGKFWDLHDLMTAHEDDLSQPVLDQLASQVGLDVPTFDAALAAHTYASAVDADLASAHDLDLTGAPAFVINGRRIIGNRPIEQLRDAVNDALANP